MSNLKVTVTNPYLPTVVETFHCFYIDILDKDEVEMCANECCGQYLDMHGDVLRDEHPDLAWDILAAACEYIIDDAEEFDI